VAEFDDAFRTSVATCTKDWEDYVHRQVRLVSFTGRSETAPGVVLGCDAWEAAPRPTHRPGSKVTEAGTRCGITA
jgi:hypothetical protein